MTSSLALTSLKVLYRIFLHLTFHTATCPDLFCAGFAPAQEQGLRSLPLK